MKHQILRLNNLLLSSFCTFPIFKHHVLPSQYDKYSKKLPRLPKHTSIVHKALYLVLIKPLFFWS